MVKIVNFQDVRVSSKMYGDMVVYVYTFHTCYRICLIRFKFLVLVISGLCKLVVRDFLQVQDYRKCSFEQGPSSPPTDGSLIVNKVRLRMSLENVVKDIPLISDNSWSYGDLMVSALMSLSCLRRSVIC